MQNCKKLILEDYFSTHTSFSAFQPFSVFFMYPATNSGRERSSWSTFLLTYDRLIGLCGHIWGLTLFEILAVLPERAFLPVLSFPDIESSSSFDSSPLESSKLENYCRVLSTALETRASDRTWSAIGPGMPPFDLTVFTRLCLNCSFLSLRLSSSRRSDYFVLLLKTLIFSSRKFQLLEETHPDQHYFPAAEARRTFHGIFHLHRSLFHRSLPRNLLLI